MPEPTAMPPGTPSATPPGTPSATPPGDARCLAALCAALEAARNGEAPERLLAGFAEGLGAELVALLLLRDEGAAVRALASRERRSPAPELQLRLPPQWANPLIAGQPASGTAGELPPDARAWLRLAPGAAVLLAPVAAVEGPGALLIAGEGPWSAAQLQALRGLAAGLGGWQTARGLQQVLDHLPQRVAWKDRALRYRGANRAFVRSAGLTSAQLLARLDAELPLRAESGEHDAAAAGRDQAALTHGPQLQQLERVPLPGGRELWFNVSRVPVDGVGLVIVREDISARVALGHQLQLARRMAMLGDLATGVSADLRPLAAAILADLTIVRDDPAAQGRIAEAARRADELARQLLGFARRQLLEPVDVVPGQLLARMQPTLARVLGPTIALAFAPPSLRWVTRIDPRLLELLLVLLARDARQRLARGRVTLELGPETLGDERARERALPAGEYLRLRWSAATDAAPDDDDDDGLSLALARTVAASAGGALRPGRGAGGALLRELHLPRVFSAPRPDETEAGPVQDLRGVETLLLLEPDLDLRRALAAVLRHLGYRVLATDQPAVAIDLLIGTGPEAHVPATRVALALVSSALPGPEQLVQRLRERAPALRLLWLAASAAATGPAGDALVVPCSFEALALRVRQALEARPT